MQQLFRLDVAKPSPNAAYSAGVVTLPFTRNVPSRRWLGFVSEAGEGGRSLAMPMGVITAMGAVLLVASGGHAKKSEPEALPSSAAAAVVSRPASEAPAAPEADPDPPAPPAAPAPPETPVQARNADVDVDVDVDAAESNTTDAAAPTVRDRPRREPKPLKPLNPAAQRRAKRAQVQLRGAVSDGRVHASRASFAVRVAGEDTSWALATDHCQGLDVDGTSGWRLPSRSEARELQRAHALDSGAFWTRQRSARLGDAIYVYDTRTRRSAPWLEEETAAIVCVQPRPR